MGKKLKPKEVLEIYNSDKSNAELSRIYHVSDATCAAIKNGKTWREITQCQSIA